MVCLSFQIFYRLSSTNCTWSILECFVLYMCTTHLTHFTCVAFHIETSHLICSANQMIGFYMKCNTRLKSFIRYVILGKEKYISPTIAQLSVFMCAFCHMCVENLLKRSAPPYAHAHPHMMNKNLFLPMI